MSRIDRYIGRIVSLKDRVYREICARRLAGHRPTENCFLVAASGGTPRRLVCYGGNLRITVDVADVVVL